ncbi:hypothetical protein BJ170DRAFT_677094 [Xylariales sp. AK1849]|nr:hypothetical protein BJ170DRAFT_677094 [Xylariales sp. AK1849]
MAFNQHSEQPGLEVVPEPEAPQVIEGPTIQKAWDPSNAAGHQYAQQHAPVNGVNGGYAQYPQSPYADSTHPASQWSPSHVDTLGPSASEKPPGPRICGIPRKKFWLIFGPLLVVLVIGLAVGLGVGLGTSHSSGSSATASSASATASSTTSSATPTSTVSSIACPGNNGSLYDATNSKEFLVLCNLDYNSGGGSQDIGNVETATVEDCANACAANGGCAGAGWGDYYGTTYCWMKSSLGTSQSAGDWFFVIKQ